MSPNEKIVVAIIIVCIIVWVLYTLYKTKYLPSEFLDDIYDDMVYKSNFARSLKSPETLYDETIGYHNDDTTKLAFEKTKKRKDANERNKNLGIISKSAINELAVDSFVMGELMRYNMNNDDDTAIRAYYDDVLNTMEHYPRAVVTENTNQLHPTPETMLYRIEDYYNDNVEDIVPNFTNIRHNLTNVRVNEANNNNVMTTYVNNFKNRKRSRPRRNPINLTKKERAVDEYFEIKDVRSDGQNVHDREVNNEMADKYNKILELNKLDHMMTTGDNYADYTIDDIGRHLQNHKFSGDKKEAAELVYNKIRSGATISRLRGSREDDIAVSVWKRIHSGENHKNRENLQDAFMDSLANSAQKNYNNEYKEVCVTGRCANILGSLTLLDNNEQLSGSFKTTEIMKNEIFDKSYKILQNELAKTDEKTRDLYNVKIPSSGDADDAIIDKFTAHVQKKIETKIVKDYPNADKSVVNNIIEEAKAGI